MEILIWVIAGVTRLIEIVLLVYFTASSLYVFTFAIAGMFYPRGSSRNLPTPILSFRKIAIFIPAFKEDSIIVDVANVALQQNYPLECFDVIIIADSLKRETIQSLNRLPIKVVEVSFKNSTKSKALNKAMESIEETYDYALILDADNVMENQFLKKMNRAFQENYKVVQGHRKAKNLNTSFAILDAASEEINNHIFRRGHRSLGLSSGLIGSGMAFEYDLFRSIMEPINAVGGFDKELEFELAKANVSIEYLQDALVFDEKIQKGKDFSTQRKRWLATQFIYLRKYFSVASKQFLLNQNINLFDKAFQLLIPARLLLLGSVFVITGFYSVLKIGLNYPVQPALSIWSLNLILVVLTFLIALPKSFYNRRTLKALSLIPNAFLRMFYLLFDMKGANKKFIHTSHGIIKN
jgi:cellulose synthase/poly-beta-1,6-N-acetylglucosamine synthase-like glycosyltransferase